MFHVCKAKAIFPVSLFSDEFTIIVHNWNGFYSLIYPQIHSTVWMNSCYLVTWLWFLEHILSSAFIYITSLTSTFDLGVVNSSWKCKAICIQCPCWPSNSLFGLMERSLAKEIISITACPAIDVRFVHCFPSKVHITHWNWSTYDLLERRNGSSCSLKHLI